MTHRRRFDDRYWWWVFFWRHVVTLAALAIAVFAVVSAEDKADRAEVKAELAQRDAEANRRQAMTTRAGRQVAIQVLCGGLAGVEEAGRLVLTDRLPSTERFQRPSTRGERRLRAVYAEAYNRVISEAIIDEAGLQATDMLKRDGTIRCDKLKTAARANP